VRGAICIEQRLSIGGNFDGATPPGDPVNDGFGLTKYAAAAVGGRFDFRAQYPDMTPDQQWMMIEQVEFNLALPVGGTYQVIKESDSGDTVLWKAGGGPTELVMLETVNGLIMAHDQFLKIVTAGAGGVTAISFARVYCRPLGYLTM